MAMARAATLRRAPRWVSLTPRPGRHRPNPALVDLAADRGYDLQLGATGRALAATGQQSRCRGEMGFEGLCSALGPGLSCQAGGFGFGPSHDWVPTRGPPGEVDVGHGRARRSSSGRGGCGRFRCRSASLYLASLLFRTWTPSWLPPAARSRRPWRRSRGRWLLLAPRRPHRDTGHLELARIAQRFAGRDHVVRMTYSYR